MDLKYVIKRPNNLLTPRTEEEYKLWKQDFEKVCEEANIAPDWSWDEICNWDGIYQVVPFKRNITQQEYNVLTSHNFLCYNVDGIEDTCDVRANRKSFVLAPLAINEESRRRVKQFYNGDPFRSLRSPNDDNNGLGLHFVDFDVDLLYFLGFDSIPYGWFPLKPLEVPDDNFTSVILMKSDRVVSLYERMRDFENYGV